MKLAKLSAIFLSAVLAVAVFNHQLAASTFTPLRQFYVSPSGTGPGTDQAHPMSLGSALNQALPGDEYWLLAGTYSGLFNLTRSGTSANPIVFRAMPGNHAIINGGLDVTGAYNWIWGLEITDPNNLTTLDSALCITAAGVRVINNVVHDAYDKNGIGAWNSGPGQVIYGNIVYNNGQGGTYHPHNIYTQNDYLSNGYKEVIQNILLDSADVCNNCWNFHAYTETGYVTGYHLLNNIIKNGPFLIGGYNVPADNEVVAENYFYQSKVQFGYKRPSQAQFTDNYLGRSTLSVQWFWGAGETIYTQTVPNQFTGNQILLPPANHVDFRTSAYLSTGRCEGCPRIQGTDTFDGNTYSSPFHASFFANNTNLGTINFSAWKNATASAGKAFDTTSTEVPAPTGTKIVLLSNEYEPGRANLAIYNWSQSANVSVDLSSLLPTGTSYAVYPAKSVYGTPVVSGTYNGPVTVPLGGAEFSAFVVIGDLGSGGNTPPAVNITFPASGASYTEPASIAIDANASDSDGSVSRVDFYANSTLIGTDTTSPYSVTWSNVPAGSYQLTARATDNQGTQTTSAAISVTVNPVVVLPSPWQNQDVGSVGVAGVSSYSGGTFTIKGSGADIWGSADAFQYAYQTLSGNGQIVARVASVQNTNSWAKAGVMIRESLAANSTNAMMAMSATSGASFQRRTATGGASSSTKLTGIAAPYWIKVTRSGSTFSGYVSSNGSNWMLVGSATISMATTAYFGLAVTSHDNTVLNTSTFDNTAVGSASNAPPTVVISSPLNGTTFAEPANVAISATAADSDGAVSRVDFYSGTTLIGSDTTSPFSTTWGNVPAGSYVLTARATDNLGAVATSTAVNIVVLASWQNQDVGNVGVAGSGSQTGGTFAVSGSGADIWGSADAFHYMDQALSGDGQIVARVVAVQNTNAWAKAGVMIRESLAANSINAMMLISAGSGASFQWRTSTGGSSTSIKLPGMASPYWVKIVRSGNTITGFVSANGQTWTQAGSTTIAMASSAYIGLAVTSHNNAMLCASTFDNVTVTP